MRAPDGSEQEGRLKKVLAELRAIRQSVEPSFTTRNLMSPQ